VCGVIEVPEKFERIAIELNGSLGATWTRSLPGLVDDLMRRWSCSADGAVMHGGVGIIVPVRCGGDGSPAVIKVSPPHPGNAHEADAFAAWSGHGAVTLLERDDDQYAMLLERASATTLASLDSPDEIARVLGEVSRRLAIPAPAHLPRLREQASGWEERLRTDAAELGHGMAPRVIDAAIATVRDLGAAAPDTMIHGDLHGGNVLRAEREPWLAVDPKGYAGDPGYDGGTAMKATMARAVSAGDPVKAALRLIGVFAEAAGLDPEHVRRWTQYHLVDTALWGRRHGFSSARDRAQWEPLVALAELGAQMLM
jgi:streptomycin 6-kinase